MSALAEPAEARRPPETRDAVRLLVVGRTGLRHARFSDLPALLELIEGDHPSGRYEANALVAAGSR